jgi:hypothetical protein
MVYLGNPIQRREGAFMEVHMQLQVKHPEFMAIQNQLKGSDYMALHLLPEFMVSQPLPVA